MRWLSPASLLRNCPFRHLEKIETINYLCSSVRENLAESRNRKTTVFRPRGLGLLCDRGGVVTKLNNMRYYREILS